MAKKALYQLLENLGLINNDCVFFTNKDDGPCFVFSERELNQKITSIAPDAFYIFNKQPLILFFDLSKNISSEREENIHKQAWSFDQAPLIFILKDADIIIYNAFEYEKKINRLKKIDLIGDININGLFSFWNLQSGQTWKWLSENHYNRNTLKNRVNQKLFENIKSVREGLTNNSQKRYLTEDQANTLILRLIFIRYLIDRGVNMDPFFISGNDTIKKRASFYNLIRTPSRLNAFFTQLNQKFNGVLFKDITIKLTQEQATALANVFSGDNPSHGTPTLFDDVESFYFNYFDFNIIPVEVISGIYESLIDEDTRNLQSAVYTPSFLVEHILSSTIDIFFAKRENKKKAECTVFDPSCGSGIFLVQSFRRMVDRELYLTKSSSISKVRLREIAQNNLFGIDLNAQALKVACFSIYIAMLDYQDPKSILVNFHFPVLLGENLFEADYFDREHNYNLVIGTKRSLAFILGNPPWKSTKGKEHLSWLKDTGLTTGRYEIAASFLERSKDFMTTETVTSLVVTSTIFYNISKPAKQFRQTFLTQFCLDYFFDLSPVRRLIFEEKNSPAAVVTYRLSDGSSHLNNTVLHQSAKSNIYLKYYNTLIIEKQDSKLIRQCFFIDTDWLFKVVLYGGTLDYLFIKKLKEKGPQLIKLKSKGEIHAGAGIKSNQGEDYGDFLIGLPLLENENINQYYTQPDAQTKVLESKDVYYESARDKKLFYGSKILIKEQARNESYIVISLVKENCCFKNGVFGITSNNEALINQIFSYIITDLYTYYIYTTSCSWGISTRPQIRLEQEILAFPFIEPSEAIKKQLAELVIAFLNPFENYYKQLFRSQNLPINNNILSKINELINGLYGITEQEKDLIDYALTISRYQFQESKQHKFIKKVHNNQEILSNYAKVVIATFSKIYEKEYIQAEIFTLNNFIAINFVFLANQPEITVKFNESTTNEKVVLESISKNISIAEISKGIYIQKDIKGYESNSFYIIKPNEYKCWHRAMAWYDISEIKADIQKAELQRLKHYYNNAAQ